MVVAHYGLEQPEEAIEGAQRSCAFLERKLAADPTPQSRYELAMSQGWLADAFTMAGRYQEALAIHRSLVRDFEELVAKDDSDPQWADFLEMSRDRVQSMEAAFRTLAEKEPNSPLLAPVVPASKQAAPMPEDLRQSADNYMKRGLWEAAATVLEKLLAQGAPVAECGPKLVTCLLSAHAEVLPGDAEKIEKLAAQLDAAGHAAEAAEVRAQLAARQFNPPPRPWWKLW
jgi:tetratricopeptide (TPR) repeat protein